MGVRIIRRFCRRRLIYLAETLCGGGSVVGKELVNVDADSQFINY